MQSATISTTRTHKHAHTNYITTRSSWLIGSNKSVTNIGNHFQRPTSNVQLPNVRLPERSILSAVLTQSSNRKQRNKHEDSLYEHTKTFGGTNTLTDCKQLHKSRLQPASIHGRQNFTDLREICGMARGSRGPTRWSRDLTPVRRNQSRRVECY